mgnify:CR=1 FL=1
MDISKTDVATLISYLGNAAELYDEQKGQRYVCRAHMLRQMKRKLENKLSKWKQETSTATGHS